MMYNCDICDQPSDTLVAIEVIEEVEGLGITYCVYKACDTCRQKYSQVKEA